MEFYKILRIKEGKQFAISKTGLSLMKSEPDFEKNYTVIGQCDVNGNLLDDVKTANFSPKVEDSEIPPIFNPKLNENGKSTADTGTAGSKAGANEETGKKGKPGRKPKQNNSDTDNALPSD